MNYSTKATSMQCWFMISPVFGHNFEIRPFKIGKIKIQQCREIVFVFLNLLDNPSLTSQFHDRVPKAEFPSTGTSTLVPAPSPCLQFPQFPGAIFLSRGVEYYFAPRELNIPANFPKLFPANILPCLKYLAWKDFRGDGYRGRVSPRPVPVEILGHGTGL